MPSADIHYRFAEPGGADLEEFTRMLRLYLKEQHGSSDHPVLVTRRNVDTFRDLARAYLGGGMFGVVVFALHGDEVIGFTLAGEDWSTPWLDTTWGKQAQVWVVWVRPEDRATGAALGMLSFGRPRLVELGFKAAFMSVWEENKPGHALCHAFGAKLVDRIYTFPLAEEPKHGSRR